MKFSVITDPVQTPDAEFEYLRNLLMDEVPRRYTVELPENCSPRKVNLAIGYKFDLYHLRFQEEIEYSGSDANFEKLCSAEIQRFPTLEEMRDFLRSMHPENEQHIFAAEPLQPHPMPETERDVLKLTDPAQRTARKLDPERLTQDITKIVRGQDAAVSTVVRYACAAAAKTHPQRPYSILLAGETGQGKTLLGKTLAQAMNCQLTDRAKHFGSITVHCNELTENPDVSRLTGASPNYVGYGDENVLSPVMENPYQVIVFDEIEKAAPRVLDVLMGVLDCGEIMLSKPIDGRSVMDMKHCFLIFTTNLPLNRAQAKPALGFHDAEPAKQDTEADLSTMYRNALVAKGMRREIAARFTEIVCFEKLNETTMVDIILQSVQNCAAEYGFRIRHVAPEIVQALYDQIDASGFGARMVNRVVSGRFDLFFAGHNETGSGGTFDLCGDAEKPELVATAS